MDRYLKNFSALLVFAWLAFAMVPSQAASPRPAKNRLVIQVSEDDTKKWNSVLGNIHNIQSELVREGVAVTVVAIGPGLGMLTAESLVANRVQDAQAEGVRFVACGNSMQAQQMTRDDLNTGVQITKAGYVEIMRLQQQGWSYLRP